MPYRVVDIDLSAVIAEKEIAAPSARVTEIAILDVPGGAEFQLRVGRGNPYFKVTKAFSMEPRGADGNDGVHAKNPTAQAGMAVQIIVGYGGDNAALGTVV